MKVSKIEQLVTPGLNYPTHLPYNHISSIQVVSQHIRCVSPMIFSQKLYQFKGLEIAEEFERAVDANSLEQINNLFDRLVKPGEGEW